MRIRSSSSSPPSALSLAALPPAPIPSAATPVQSQNSPLNASRVLTPFDELPMSHLISFPLIDSPDSKRIRTAHDQSFEPFNSIQNPFSAFHGSSALLRDAFDYYRLPNTNPTPISDALNMPFHGSAFKSQLQSMHDLSSVLSFQHQHQHQPCIPTAQLFTTAAAVTTPSLRSPSQVPTTSPISPLMQPMTSPSSSTTMDDHSRPHLFPDSAGQIVIPPSTSTSNSSSSPISQSSQPSKKRPPRATISTKDFVPPDVTGLSKREARLVKNRAAAFLSRQRKREEFECMELRVAQLEQENARLLTLTQQFSSSSPSSSRSPSPSQLSSKHLKINSAEPSNSDPSSLRSLLAESRARAAELEKELKRLRSNPTCSSPSPSSESGSELGSPPRGPIQIKREPTPPELIPNPKRTSASLFGVVLLCALPSLLSLPAPIMPHAASRFSFNPGPGSVNHQPHGTESLLDWPAMDIDDDPSGSSRRKVNLPLSFLNSQNDLLQQQNFINGGAGPDLSLLPPIPPDFEAGSEAEFDVSFMTSPNEGKIRVRIEGPSPPGSGSASGLPSSSSSSPLSSSASAMVGGGGGGGGVTSSSPRSSGLDSPSFTHSSPSDNWDLEFSAPDHTQGLMWDSPSAAPTGANVDLSIFSSDISSAATSCSSNSNGGSRRRVRIALKTGPVVGAEGGEWEVEVC